jgi:1-acyl-sn-glycerol-3-phosphate acyltransferase
MIMSILRLTYTISILIPLTLIFALIAFVLAPLDLLEREQRLSRGLLGRGATWVKITWCRLILWFHRVRIEAMGPGLKNVENFKGVVFVSNHQSVLDIPAIWSVIPKDSAFLAKRELAKIPFFGWAAYLAGTQFVDRSRGNRDPSLEALNRHIQQGVSIIFFPEGTRSTTGELLSFKRGAFVTAIQNQRPIVPLAIHGSARLCPKHSFSVRSGRIRIWVGEPIETSGLGLQDRSALADRVKSLIAKDLASMQE